MDNMPQQAPYGVYVCVDDAGRITAINSDAFLPDTTGWTRIDEGYGDKYHHAQGNYLEGPLYDDRGIPRYKLADGEVQARTREDIDGDYVPPVPTPTAEEQIAELRTALEALMGGIKDA